MLEKRLLDNHGYPVSESARLPTSKHMLSSSLNESHSSLDSTLSRSRSLYTGVPYSKYATKARESSFTVFSFVSLLGLPDSVACAAT